MVGRDPLRTVPPLGVFVKGDDGMSGGMFFYNSALASGVLEEHCLLSLNKHLIGPPSPRTLANFAGYFDSFDQVVIFDLSEFAG